MKLTMSIGILTLGTGCFLAPVQARAQAGKAGSDWNHVMALPTATEIDLRTASAHVRCVLTQVTEDSLACSRGVTTFSFQRSEVHSIKIGHRGRSALIGGAIGGGGLGIGLFAATSSSGDSLFGPNFLRGQATAVGLGAGAVIGGGIGALTDFSKSTVYRAR